MNNNISRRNALKITAASAAVAPAILKANCGSCAGEKKAHAHPKISLQLYSVRGSCKKGFDTVLEAVKKMGYEGVEFAGYHNYGGKAKDLKKRLDDLGLLAAGTHIGARSFEDKSIQKTIDFHKEIGCKYLICPGDGRFCHKENSKSLAELFNKAAEKLKPVGLYCGYHNHSKEMKTAEGDKTWWDLFAERTGKDVVLQQDCGWTAAAGRDPVEFIKKYPGRTLITHYKTHGGEKPIIGQDGVKWADVYKACCEVGGTEWITIEQERYIKGKSDLECSEMSLKGLKEIIAKCHK